MMPAVSMSHDKFVLMILKLRKPHTIRQRRKNPIKARDVLTIYYKQRTRQCRAIALTVVKQVIPVVIYPFEGFVKLNGLLLTEERTQKLTWRDGFDTPDNFFEFFKQYERAVLDDFVLIEWNTEKFIPLWDFDSFQTIIRGMSAADRLGWIEASYKLKVKNITREQWQKEYLNEWVDEVHDE